MYYYYFSLFSCKRIYIFILPETLGFRVISFAHVHLYLLLLVSTQLQVPFPVKELCPYICQAMPIKFEFVCSFYILLGYVPKLTNGNLFCLQCSNFRFSWPNVLRFFHNIHVLNTQAKFKLVNIPFMVPALCPLLTLARSGDIHVHVLLTHS